MKATKVGKRSSVVTRAKLAKTRFNNNLCLDCGVSLTSPEAKKPAGDAATLLPFEGYCAHHRKDVK